MTDDNVVSLNQRKQNRLEELEEQFEDLGEQMKAENFDKMIMLLDAVKQLICDGEIDSLAVVARNPRNGIFLSETLIADNASVDVYTAYIGQLEKAKMEAVDMASAGPHMMPDGSYFAITDNITHEEDLDGLD